MASKKVAKKSASNKKSSKKAVTKSVSSKKSSSKAAPKKKSAAKREVFVLSSEERRSKLKPRENYDEIVDQLMRAMNNNPRVRIDGVKASLLGKLLRQAQKANAKENDLRDQMTRKLAPATDRRISSEDALWRAVLDVNAGVKPYARKDGTVADAFAFLTAALTGTRSEPAEPEGGEPAS